MLNVTHLALDMHRLLHIVCRRNDVHEKQFFDISPKECFLDKQNCFTLQMVFSNTYFILLETFFYTLFV